MTEQMSAADNLREVGKMIREGGMWCKGDWTAWNDASESRVGCLEGLLAEQLGLYEGFSNVYTYVMDGTHSVTGQILNFLQEDEGEVQGCWHLEQLRETEEWSILADWIQENRPQFSIGKVEKINAVVCFNDDDDTTALDAAEACEKAAANAP